MSWSFVFWGAIVLLVFISGLFRYLTRSSQHRMLERLAEKGQSLSPELLASIGNGRDREYRHSGVQSGIFLMCIGIAIAVFFWAMSGGGGLFHGIGTPSWLPVVGIFPFMIGLARLLGGFTDRRPPK